MTTYRSNLKHVRELVKKHIEEYKEGIWNQPLSISNRELVDIGVFLVYYDDAREFIDSLHLNNNSNREFTDAQVWHMYKTLITRELDKIRNN